MKLLSLASLVLVPVFALTGCMSVSPTMPPTQLANAPISTAPILTPVITVPESTTPTSMASLPSNTPSPTTALIPFDTLEPAQAKETIEPLVKDPMNCAVPCFWGIVPGKTHLDEVRNFFSRLGFTTREGNDFYSVGYKPDNGDGFSTIFYTFGTTVESIEVTPYITKQAKDGSPRKWIAYSPESLIKRYGSPSRVQFAVDLQQSVAIVMIMYFDTSGLIALYSGYNMTLERFCPLTAPFDSVRLWMGNNPPNTPSFETIPLEKATSLTTDQFTQLMTGDPGKACFSLKEAAFP